MPRKEFESFTRLDASDVNTYLMDQSVMTFAGTAARGSAIGTATEGMVTYLTDIDALSVYNGTQFVTNRPIMTFAGTAARGSAIPSPIEGMTTYLEDANRLDFYDGSAHVPASGLTFIKSETFTNVNSVSFNTIFSSLYKDYFFVFSGTHTTGNADIFFRLREATTDNTTSNYFAGAVSITAAAGPTRSYLSSQAQAMCANVQDLASNFSFTISDPFNTVRKTAFAQSTAAGSTDAVFRNSWCFVNIATSFDGITFFLGSGNYTGTITAYGYRK